VLRSTLKGVATASGVALADRLQPRYEIVMKVAHRNDLSLRLLEIFGTLMLHQTTVAAAEELGISQPSVSTAIKQLEGQVGITLFTREKKRLIPTDDARSLFLEVEPLFEQMRSVESCVRDLRSGSVGKLRIMATPPMGYSVVPRVLRAFLAARPGVTVHFDVGRLDRVIDSVTIGAVEIGFCLAVDSFPSVHVRKLRTDGMVALMRADHPLAKLPVIGPRDLVGHELIGLETASRLGLLLQTAFEQARVPYLPQTEVRYCHTAAILARSGNGVAVVDRHTAAFLPGPDVVIRPFDPPIPVAACLLTRPSRPLTRLASEFSDLFVQELMG